MKESLIVQYKEFRRDMKSLPVGSLMYRRTQQRMSDFLERVRDAYGQKVVDELTKRKSDKK